jgi:DNA primase large subunit
VDENERKTYESQLKAAVPDADEKELYFKVILLPNRSLCYTDDVSQVKWTSVPDLVEKRRVFLKDGWAYVPSKERSSIVFQEFQTRLEEALQVNFTVLYMKVVEAEPRGSYD